MELKKVAILTKQINTIEQGGGRANELRDQRALLIDNLSEYREAIKKDDREGLVKLLDDGKKRKEEVDG